MSETRFTPGPWVLATSCSWRRIVSERGEPVCVPTVQRSDSHPDLHFPNGGECGPDARLIEAAPDLYEALRLAVANWLPNNSIYAREANAALAKARGEQS